MRDLGDCHVLIGWVQTFFSDRSMQVVAGGAASREMEVISGVLQESVLGFVLFFVYINHVTNVMVSCYKAFADDSEFYLS